MVKKERKEKHCAAVEKQVREEKLKSRRKTRSESESENAAL